MSFDISSFTTPEDFSKIFAGKPEVRNPRANEDIFAHTEWRTGPMAVTKIQGDIHLVHPNMYPALAGEMSVVEFLAVMSSTDGVFVWAVGDRFAIKEAAKAVTGKWGKIVWNNKSRQFEAQEPAADRGIPVWPYKAMQELLQAALTGRTITGPDDLPTDRS